MKLSFTAKTAGSNRTIRFDQLAAPAIIACVTQASSPQAISFGPRLRETHADPSIAGFLIVVDLRAVPRLLRKPAEGILNGRYKDLAADLPAGRVPEEWIFILPDWNGTLLGAFGFTDVSSRAGFAVVDATGELHGTFQGESREAEAMACLAGLVATAAAESPPG
ncbi:hypothetical protein AYO38_07285 [bacterium SCGC AG-212-C10]|nr:hypothetical protein AYO38_07285 [bacterium SCGC AG-212-C10]